MRVRIPDPLRSYTGREKVVEATGGTVAEALNDVPLRTLLEDEGIRA